jgi:hypothetical protein
VITAEAPEARSFRSQATSWAGAAHVPASVEIPVTSRRASTMSVSWTSSALDGPLLVTVMVKVLPVEPAVTVSGSSPAKSFTTSRSTTSTIATESSPVAVLSSASVAVAALSTSAGSSSAVTE